MIQFIKKHLRLLIALTIIGVLILLGYKYQTQAQTNKKKESTTVVRGNLTKTLTVSGEIDAEEKVTLRFQTSGRLAWVGVKEGDYVKKYQTVASLDQKELKTKLSKYLNDYMKERYDFDQTTKDDYRDKVVTDAIKRTLYKAQLDLENSVSDVEIQNLTLEFSNLWTPIEGIVTKVLSPFAGVNITPAQSEFEIVNPKTVYFKATADQTEVVDLKEGMKGELVLDAYPDKKISGVIKNISFAPKSGETGVVYTVKFVFNEENLDYHYRLGMAGDLEFATFNKENVLYLPNKFVKEEKNSENGEAGKKYVMTEQNGKSQKTYVETGAETDDYTEILSGLDDNQVVSL